MNLTNFQKINLEEMEDVKFMNRTDTKFIFHTSWMEEFLKVLKENYTLLEIGGSSLQEYKTLYFDDSNFTFYKDHHNKKPHRYKVRMRNYVNSQISFLEIKEKVRGKTFKSRIQIPSLDKSIDCFKDFIHKDLPKNIHLQPTLVNYFERMTFVNFDKTERLTIDTNIRFINKEESSPLENLLIAELKQSKLNRNSAFYRLMKKNQIRPSSMSKYCIGLIQSNLDNKIKYNRFKSKLRLIEKTTKNENTFSA